MTTVIDSVRGEYLRYKELGEKAIAQLSDEDLSRDLAGDANSIATICWHISGNLKSRFTDFLTSDGEKPWRHRDEEFAARSVTRDELLAKWNEGWSVLTNALSSLSDDQLEQMVKIRSQPLTVAAALHRSLAHTSYHVGQIVYIAKSIRGADWNSLSIPRGKSDDFNRKMRESK
ncbi:MAG TPA: DinB family protein [Gemmatimonadaceae bacterium]|jgi:uncharacterized damage-inducible protein DinB|nr:DinB family protein [Gemmatimonadaceae bacterium]